MGILFGCKELMEHLKDPQLGNLSKFQVNEILEQLQVFRSDKNNQFVISDPHGTKNLIEARKRGRDGQSPKDIHSQGKDIKIF